jgi:predicted small secreted protein
MKIIAMLLVALLLFSAVMLSGCITASGIENPEDVSKAVSNISSGVEDIESILTDIDEDLG